LQVFGHRDLHSLEDGLRQMAAWVKQHGARSSKPFQNIEITKNFPKAWLVTEE
jgi:UDP-glucose 4-epimerase